MHSRPANRIAVDLLHPWLKATGVADNHRPFSSLRSDSPAAQGRGGLAANDRLTIREVDPNESLVPAPSPQSMADDSAPQDSMSSAQTLAGVVRFLRAVRLRKGLVGWSLVVSFVLGGIYYATATRYYESMAGLLVLNTSSNVMHESAGG